MPGPEMQQLMRDLGDYSLERLARDALNLVMVHQMLFCAILLVICLPLCAAVAMAAPHHDELHEEHRKIREYRRAQRKSLRKRTNKIE